MLEERIVRFCAPTLAGIKTGSLFNTCGIPDEVVRGEVDALKDILSAKGLGIRLFTKPGRKPLIYVYRKTSLQYDLAQFETKAFLKSYGYETYDIEQALDRLGERIEACDIFPHEVGVFLSYPLDDVKNFIEKGGQSCKCSGYWCVYTAEDKARWCFNRYDICTSCYKRLYQRGHRLSDLAVVR